MGQPWVEDAKKGKKVIIGGHVYGKDL